MRGVGVGFNFLEVPLFNNNFFAKQIARFSCFRLFVKTPTPVILCAYSVFDSQKTWS